MAINVPLSERSRVKLGTLSAAVAFPHGMFLFPRNGCHLYLNQPRDNHEHETAVCTLLEESVLKKHEVVRISDIAID